MNKIYRVIWNHATNAFVVVSELNHAKGKAKSATSAVAQAAVIALGIVATVDAQAAVNIGTTSGTTVRAQQTITSTTGIAIGGTTPAKAAKAGGTNAIAIGEGAAAGTSSSSGAGVQDGIAIGTATRATEPYTIAMGSVACATKEGAIAIGKQAYAAGASGDGAIAIGNRADSGGADATAVGNNANAAGEQATSLGNGTFASNNATALGNSASAGDESAIALGHSAQGQATNATAIGTNATANSENATATGTGSVANSENATASGTSASATGVGSIATGTSALTNGDNAIATGTSAQATAENATATGTSAQATAANATATGTSAQATAENATATGTNAQATAENATATGTDAVASGTNSIASGTGAQALANKAVAIGSGAVANSENSVALGSGSVAGTGTDEKNTTVNGISYDYGASTATLGSNADNVVSVGSVGAERQIKNVATGNISAGSTDAINGAQLYQITNAVTTAGVITVDPNTGEVTGTITPNTPGFVNATTVAQALSSSGWNIGDNSLTTVGLVNPSEQVNFINGNGTTSSVVAVGNNFTVSYGIDYANAVSPVTITSTGTAEVPTNGGNGAKLVNATTLTDTINGAFWSAKQGANVNTNVDTSATATTSNINAGDNVTFVAGKNLVLAKTDEDNGTTTFTYATKDAVQFNTSVTIGTGTDARVLTQNNRNLTLNGGFINGLDPSSHQYGKNQNPNRITTTTGNTNLDSAINAAAQGMLTFNEGTSKAVDESAVVTNADLKRYGWIVSASNTTTGAYAAPVKNADIVDFVGANGVKVEGETNATTGIRQITISVDNSNSIQIDNVTAASNGSVTLGTGQTGNNLTTAGDLVSAINNSGWNIFQSDFTATNKIGLVKPSNNVSFINGTNTVATVANTTDGYTVKYDTVAAATLTSTNGLLNLGSGTTGDQLMNASSVANAINASGFTVSKAYRDATRTDRIWNATSSQWENVVVPNFFTQAELDNNTTALIKPGSTLSFGAGDGLQVIQKTNATTGATEFFYQIAPNATLKNVSIQTVTLSDSGYLGSSTTINGQITTNTNTASWAVTAEEVAKAINASFWTLKTDNSTPTQSGGTDEQGAVKPGGSINFVSGNGVTVTSSEVDDANNFNVSFAVNQTALSQDATNLGKVATPTAADSFVNASTVATAINSSYWRATQGASNDTNADTSATAQDSEINAGDNVTFVAGKNMALAKTTDANGNTTFTYATKDAVQFNTSVTIGNTDTTVLTSDSNGLKVENSTGAAQTIYNVADATLSATSSEVVNGSQLYDAANSVANVLGGSTTFNTSSGTVTGFSQTLSTTPLAATATYTAPAAATTVSQAITNLNNYVNAGWKIGNASGSVVERIAPNEQVNFVNSSTIASKVVANSQGGANVSFEIITGSLVSGTTGSVATATTGVATTADVKDAINKSGWQITSNGNTPTTSSGNNSDGIVNPSDSVNFVNGTGTTAKIVATDSGGYNVSFDVDKASMTTTLTANSTTGKIDTPTNGDNFVNATTLQTAINSTFWTAKQGARVETNKDTSGIADSNISAGDSVTFIAGKNIVLEKTTEANGETKFTYATKDAVQFDNSVTIGNSAAAQTTLTSSTDGLKVANATGDAQKITNVANGTADSDAVNVSQLKALNTTITTLNTQVQAGLNYRGNDGSAIAAPLASTINVVGAHSGTNTDKGANIFVRTNTANLTVELAKALNVETVTTGDTTLSDSGITINNGNGNAGTVSVTKDGLNNGGNVITNVEAGVNDTDAVNVSQLNGAIQTAVAGAAQQMGDINIRMGEMNKDLRAGIASAVATAGLPQAYMPGKSLVAIGGGTYKGEAGYAVGVSSISDSGNWIMKGTASGNSRGGFTASAAIGYQW